MFYCAIGAHQSKPGERKTLKTVELRQVVNHHKGFTTTGLEIAREIAVCPTCLPTVPDQPVIIGTKNVFHNTEEAQPPTRRPAFRCW